LLPTTIYHFSTLGIVWSLFVDGPPTDEFLKNALGSLESQGQQARPRTRKAVSASLENLRKKRNRAGEAVKARISRIDQLLQE
jgi:hypothetical protein